LLLPKGERACNLMDGVDCTARVGHLAMSSLLVCVACLLVFLAGCRLVLLMLAVLLALLIWLCVRLAMLVLLVVYLPLLING
jgi:hypothetical protein